ncbi:MAG: PorP/SprF family type IX secretion system membrane protein [bacterium]
MIIKKISGIMQSGYRNKWIRQILTGILFLTASTVHAQQIPISSHFYENQFIYNPSAIGMQDYTQAFFHARKQWMGIQGSPETYHFTMDGSLNNKKAGLGLMLFSDKSGIVGRTGGYGAYRYRLNLNNEHLIYLGISAGFLQNKIFFEKIQAEDITETTLLNTTEKQTVFDANAGVTYTYKNWKVGLSSYQLFNNNYYYEDNASIQSLKYKIIRHYLGSVRYEYAINNEFRVDPQLIVKNVQGMPLQFDIGTYFNWRDMGWIGLNYQHNYGVSLSAGGLLYDKYIISYSYDIPTGNIAGFTKGSHEFLIGIRLFNNENQYQQDRLKRNEMNHLKNLSQEQFEQIEKLEDKNKQLKTEVDNTAKDVHQQREEIKKLKEIYNKDRQQINKTIKKYRISLEDIDKMDLSEESDSKQFYVVLGAYLKLKDAKFFQRVLEREAGLETRVHKRPDGKYFFIYSRAYKKQKETKKNIVRELRLLKRLDLDEYIDGNIWIYHEADK